MPVERPLNVLRAAEVVCHGTGELSDADRDPFVNRSLRRGFANRLAVLINRPLVGRCLAGDQPLTETLHGAHANIVSAGYRVDTESHAGGCRVDELLDDDRDR